MKDFLARLNLSLAETGQLANKAFHYTQAGSDGILVPWNLNVETGECLSEMYWSTGPIPSWDPDAGASLKKYNDTFWYYIMRVNNQ